jgi:catechol 2,3-dioxygenase-like lactoylglutathione lyase family enzyme
MDSLVLYVNDLDAARSFYADFLGLPVLVEDSIVVVVVADPTRVVLHRADRGHDHRGVWPAGQHAGAAAVRLAVDDPDEWERRARASAVTVLWPSQDARWGRFVLLADPDGRPVALARMAR